jgi:iron complex transport system substrate-binding protein
MTRNGTHPVSRALHICGGENIFGGLQQLAPTVGIEAVLQANPDAIIASSGSREDVLADWRRFPQLKAVAQRNLITIDGGLLNRSGPRILDGVEELCTQLDRVRDKKR